MGGQQIMVGFGMLKHIHFRIKPNGGGKKSF